MLLCVVFTREKKSFLIQKNIQEILKKKIKKRIGLFHSDLFIINFIRTILNTFRFYSY